MLTIIPNDNGTTFKLCMLVNGEWRLVRTFRLEVEAFEAAVKLEARP